MEFASSLLCSHRSLYSGGGSRRQHIIGRLLVVTSCLGWEAEEEKTKTNDFTVTNKIFLTSVRVCVCRERGPFIHDERIQDEEFPLRDPPMYTARLYVC